MALDYWMLAANLLWIMGSAILIAVWSIGYYRSRTMGRTVLEYLQQPAVSRVVLVGLLTIFIGFTASESRILLKVLWSLMGLMTALILIFRVR
jgi:hypothetical protein